MTDYEVIAKTEVSKLDELAYHFAGEYLKASTRPNAGTAEIAHMATLLNARLNLIQIRQNTAILAHMGIQ